MVIGLKTKNCLRTRQNILLMGIDSFLYAQSLFYYCSTVHFPFASSLIHKRIVKFKATTVRMVLLSVGSGAFLVPRIIICWPTLQELWILNIGLQKDVSGSLKWHIHLIITVRTISKMG